MYVHQNEDEHFVILEGMARIASGNKTFAAPATACGKASIDCCIVIIAVGTDMIEDVLAKDINGLEPRLTRQGYKREGLG